MSNLRNILRSIKRILFLTLPPARTIRLLPITRRLIYNIQKLKFKSRSIDFLIKNFRYKELLL